jgi:hypothetical protein
LVLSGQEREYLERQVRRRRVATVDIAKVDVQKVAAGYRASKVIGSSVLNDANETIGKIDDLLVTRDGPPNQCRRRRPWSKADVRELRAHSRSKSPVKKIATARNAPACVGVEHGGRAGGHARAHGIRARGENDRHARAEYHSRRVRLGEERQVFGQHVAGFEIGHDENLRAAGDRGCDAFDLRCFGIDGVVERQRAVEDAARDLAALGHFAERGGVDGRRNFRCHSLDGGQNRNPRRAEADLREQIDHVLHDVALGKGAVRKRSQLETKTMGKKHWTKRSKESGEFMAQKRKGKFKGVRKER